MIGPDTSKSTQQGGDDLMPQRLRIGRRPPVASPLRAPLDGQRAPDLRVGKGGLFDLVSDARAVLLDFSGALNTAAEHAAALGMTTQTADPGQARTM